MQRISITNPQNIIDGTAKKYYFKLRNTGGPKGDKGDKGDTGATGPQGPQGNAATVSVGSTTTLPVGYDATVTNSGSIYNAVLDFGIPQGPQGPQGAKGDKGDTGAKGDTGPRGPQGERGTNATVYVGTTSTLNPGSQATVYNSGTDSNAVLNFGIPKGEKGDTGATGATGATGPAGQNFTPTIVAELPATGDESKLYLTPKAHTTSTATGNPITATVAEEAGAIESFQLDGDTFQKSYTGKNLLNIGATPGQVQSVSYEVIGQDLKITDTNDSGNYHYVQYWFYNLTPGEKYTASFQSVTASSGSPTGRILFVSYGTGDNPYNNIGGVEFPSNSYTFTVPSDAASIGISFYARGGSGSTYTYSQIMLEKSSTATSFEPYVGGQASPNPDYPQTVQTVTGEQTVKIVGKNLFDKDDVVNGIPSASDGTIVSTTSIGRTSGFIRVKSSTNYSHTGHPNGWATIAWYKEDKSFISRIDNATTTTSPTEAAFARVSCASTDLNTCQFEEGQPTDYAPYSHQTLPLNIGTIELCKLGTYQDYIYKDGDDWKVHKATAIYSFTGAETPTVNTSSANTTRCLMNNLLPSNSPAKPEDSGSGLSNYFVYGIVWSTDEQGIYANNRAVVFRGNKTTIGTTLAEVQTWLTTNKPILYYALDTPTDTNITDQALIAQLEAIRTASLENGTNTITNTATGSNLAGDMEIGYYGYNPTNRYDKFIWLDINDNYEQIGE